MNEIKRFYISGKITGTDDYIKRFEDAENSLKLKGLEPVNPAKVCAKLPETFEHGEYMAVTMARLEQCDGIYMLKGWQDSKGAKMEYQMAIEKGLHVAYEEQKNKMKGE